MNFDQFELSPALQRAIADAGYLSPTEIQSQAIPHILQGKDLIGCAQTGTGKTAAFAIPVPHVVNYELPNVAETYVHRIGRTGRAGENGVAISFCNNEERPVLKQIQHLIGFQVPVPTW